MDDVDSIREWLKHVPDRLLVAESGLRDNNVAEFAAVADLRETSMSHVQDGNWCA